MKNASNVNQPIYIRQRYLLSFIRHLKSGVSATDLQKLVFLQVMKEQSGYYAFIPYKFGPYSFQLAEDVEILRRDGYLAFDHSRIIAIGDYPRVKTLTIDALRGSALIKKAYKEYPYYTINSEIIRKLFNCSDMELFKNEQQKYVRTEQKLFTIGYEGKSIEVFMNDLIKNGVKLLCDVRKNPLSRKLGFSKSKLERIAENVGIKYTHIPELGIENEQRASLKTVDDYNKLFAKYTKTLSSKHRFLESIYTLLCTNQRIALMCYEKEPNMCHRNVVRNFLIDVHKVKSEDL